MHVAYDVLNLSLLNLHVIAVPSALVMLKRVKMSELVTVLHSHSTLIIVSSAKAAEHVISQGLEHFFS